MSHAEFLRTHETTDPTAFIRTLWNRARALDDAPPRVAVQTLLAQLDETVLPDPETRAVVHFVVRLTWNPGAVTSADHAPLRAANFDDRSIHDIVQVTACFAFMNRLADGTGVTLLPERYPLARHLFGPAALDAHLAWGAAPSTAGDDA